MKYSKLVVLLRDLEKYWRSRATRTFSSVWIRPRHNVQYFACRKRTGGDPDLPVVVDVGINYTQGSQKIPDERVTASHRPSVEDEVLIKVEQKCISHCNSNRRDWEKSQLVGSKTNLTSLVVPPTDFHLVMTNLSPWITTHSWESQLCAGSSGIGAHLLAHPPHGISSTGLSYEHLDDLKKHLEDVEDVALWIGHGRVTVPSHFRIFVEKHQIDNWLLTGNLSARINPRVDRSGFVKFH